MRTGPFWTKSKSSSSNFSLLGILLPTVTVAIFLFTGCTEVQPHKPVAEIPPIDRTRDGAPRRLAPWDVYDTTFDAFDGEIVSLIADAERRGADGDFAGSIQLFKDAQSKATSAQEKEFVFARKVGTMLKLGNSREVLQEASAFSKERGQKIEDLAAPIALVIAFAYEHQKDIDQTLAWLSVSYRAAPESESARAARVEVARLLRRIKDASFGRYSERWQGDPFITRLFAEERSRRKKGGPTENVEGADWFNPAYYGSTESPVATSDVGSQSTAMPSGTLAIDVIAPLSGAHQSFGERIREGVELASEMLPQGVSLQFNYLDDKGSPEEAVRLYDESARSATTIGVLGPLLAKSAELVAKQSGSARVPFLSFTKKDGVLATGSKYAGRLATTAQDQMDELASYLSADRGATKVAVIRAGGGGSGVEETAAAFRKAAERNKLDIVQADVISVGDDTAAAAVIEKLVASDVDAIFIPDGSQDALPLITRLKNGLEKRPLICGSSSWDDPVFLRAQSVVFEGTVYPSPFFLYSSRPNVVQFIERYKQRFQKAPDLLSAQAFDAATVLIDLASEAIGAAGATSPVGTYRDGLAKTLHSRGVRSGVTGQLNVEANGDIRRRMSIVTIRQGELVEVSAGGVPTGAQ